MMANMPKHIAKIRNLQISELHMLSGTLHRVSLVRTDVSENTSPLSSVYFRVISFHSCVTVESASP
jgi:hypothetical protein